MPSGVYIRTKPVWNKDMSYEECYGEQKAKLIRSKIKENHADFSGENHPQYGLRGEDGVNFGRRHTPEAVKNMGDAKKGEKHPLYGVKGEANPNYGSKRTEEQCKNISTACLGRVSCLKGKTLEEIMGSKEKAEKVIERLKKVNKGRIPWNKGQTGVYSEETLKDMSLKAIKKLADGKYPNVYTKPHKLIVEQMKNCNLWDSSWKNECGFNLDTCRGSIDIANPKSKIAIFIDGDYWHANPLKYKEDSIIAGGRLAKSIWENDKRQTDALKNDGWKVIRLWEYDIKNNAKQCLMKIRNEVKGRCN